jgi:hypothetical protein
MSLDELMPSLRELNRADKFRAMQFLVNELAREEETLLKAGAEYPVWSPYDSYEAADALLDALKRDNQDACFRAIQFLCCRAGIGRIRADAFFANHASLSKQFDNDIGFARYWCDCKCDALSSGRRTWRSMDSRIGSAEIERQLGAIRSNAVACLRCGWSIQTCAISFRLGSNRCSSYDSWADQFLYAIRRLFLSFSTSL